MLQLMNLLYSLTYITNLQGMRFQGDSKYYISSGAIMFDVSANLAGEVACPINLAREFAVWQIIVYPGAFA